MDPSAAAAVAAPTGFVGWIMANGQMVAFIGQILFWLVVGIAAVWAAATFNRYVNFMMSDDETSEAVEMPIAEKTVSVEEFVE